MVLRYNVMALREALHEQENKTLPVGPEEESERGVCVELLWS